MKIFVGDTVVFDGFLDYNSQNEEQFVSDTEYVLNVPVSREIVEKYSSFDQGETLLPVKFCGTTEQDSARLMNFLSMFWE